MSFRDRRYSRAFCGMLLFAATAALHAQLTPLTTLDGGTLSAGGCFFPIVAPSPPFAAFPIPGLGHPNGVAVDPSGRLFVSDSDNNCVYRVDADGALRIQIGAFTNPPFRIGSGPNGFAGDGGDAAAAELYGPRGLAADSAGNLYIADIDNNRIRKVDTATWTITTVAGGGNSRAFDGQLATNVALLFPSYVATDRLGNFYFSDNTQKVYKVDTNGILTKIAGSGGSSYDGSEGTPAVTANMIPEQIAVDAGGNVFIADWANSIIRKVDTHGNIFTVAGNPFNVTGLGDGNPAAFGATLHSPRGVAVDALGNIFIADTGNQRIRMVDTSGIIHTIAGNGTPGFTTGQVNFPNALAVDNLGNLFISDSGNNALRGIITTARQYQLTLSSTGTGSGTLTGQGLYSIGIFANVSASPNVGSTFDGWSGPNADECTRGTVWMDLDKSCTASFTQVQSCAANLSSSFQITRSGFAFNFTTNRFLQTLTLKNSGTSAIAGPVSIALDALPVAISLTNRAGITACNPIGSPFINAGFVSLAPGASYTVTLQFSDPSNTGITYNTRALGGPGTR